MIVTFVFILGLEMVAGGAMGLERKLFAYIVNTIPFALTFVILGYLLSKKKTISNKKLWVYSGISMLFLSLYSGTVGNVLGELMGRKAALERNTGAEYEFSTVYETIAVDMTMFYGAILALFLLPLSIPLQRYALKFFLLLFKKFDINIQTP